MNARQIQSQIATGQIERARLLDDEYYNRLVAVLTTEDEVEKKDSYKIRRQRKEERANAKWWLGIMRQKAYREYMAQKGK